MIPFNNLHAIENTKDFFFGYSDKTLMKLKYLYCDTERLCNCCVMDKNKGIIEQHAPFLAKELFPYYLENIVFHIRCYPSVLRWKDISPF